MFNLGMGEITVILLLALIFIGPKKLPDLAAGLGKLIKEIRKATSDVKNEISLDETFRKPFEDLRDAVTLHPDELKRRDQWAKEREEAAKRAADEAAKFALEEASGASGPPDGLADHVTIPMPGTEAPPAAPKLPEPHGPNDTIVQVAPPRGATLEDIPTPPPEVAPTVTKPATPTAAKPVPAAAKATSDAPKATSDAAKPAPDAPKATPDAAKATSDAAKATSDAAKATPDAAKAAAIKPAPDAAKATTTHAPLFPMGTVPRAAKPVGPSAPASTVVASTNGESAANITQILREEDLLPSFSSGGPPPPPPHLPGLRPAGAPRPNRITPPPVPPVDKKKP